MRPAVQGSVTVTGDTDQNSKRAKIDGCDETNVELARQIQKTEDAKTESNNVQTQSETQCEPGPLLALMDLDNVSAIHNGKDLLETENQIGSSERTIFDFWEENLDSF